MTKLTADVKAIKNANTQPHEQGTLNPTREETETNNYNLNKLATYAQAIAKPNNHKHLSTDISSSCISDRICTWVTLKLTINMLSSCWRLVLGQL